MKIRIAYKVSVRLPSGVSIKDMEEYISDAVMSWRGQLHPQDPIFNLAYESVVVTLLTGSPVRKNKKQKNK